jgi:carbon-monoxide dehydrogenase medium subunit
MYPSDFSYEVAPNVEAAAAMLVSTPEAKVIAGGQSLIPLLRYRLTRPPLVVDIGRIDDLRSVETRDGWVEFGALVTSAELASDRPELPPLVREAAAVIADPQVRNLGTIGGNLAHADPYNDMPAVLMAVRGSVHVTGAGGSRIIPSDDFFVGPFVTVLDPTEIVTRIDFPIGVGAYEKFKACAGDYGSGAVAVHMRLSPAGLIEQAGIAVTGIFGLAIRADAAEEMLIGTRGESKVLAEASHAVGGAGSTVDDERGSARYKSALAVTLAHRALSRAVVDPRERSK